MYCQNCGAEINDNARFCPFCGTRTDKGAEDAAAGEGARQESGQENYARQEHVYAPPPATTERKSKLAAGLLGIFLGTLGIHNFYLGYTGKALAQLLITVCTCGLGGIVTSVWGLIEGILILTGGIATDANGVPLQDV